MAISISRLRICVGIEVQFLKESVVRWRLYLCEGVFPSVSERLVYGRRSVLLIQQLARQVVNHLIFFIILSFRLGEGEEKTEQLVPVFAFEQVFGFPGQSPDILVS
jgi:hypothetical protein